MPSNPPPQPPSPGPYQPSLLRLLHGLTAAGVAAAWITGALAYNQNDRRWGSLPTPSGLATLDWIDVHGSAGVLLWPVATLFLLYAITLGKPRLRHASNALPFLALLLAIVSGKWMQEDWLRQGQLHQLVYSLHLLGWLLIAAAVAWHLTSLLRRGGPRLALSMARLKVRSNDTPSAWLSQIRRSLSGAAADARPSRAHRGPTGEP